MQGSPIKEKILDASGFLARSWVRWFQSVADILGQTISSTVRITTTDSPYTADVGMNLVCNTDGGDVTIVFPSGTQGAVIRAVNTGSSGNDLILVGGADNIAGAATKTLSDGVAYECRFDPSDGWN